MKYKITLKPLSPYLFGGDNTYGKIGDKENGTYITVSRLFPQQSALLGMLKKEIMTQSGVLTRKVRGEWVDKAQTNKAKELVGSEKFDIFESTPQNFGVIKEISPIFLQKDSETIIKKANIKEFVPIKRGKNYLLQNYNAKEDILNHYEGDKGSSYKTEDIFTPVIQTLNQKEAHENSLYKKTSYMLKDGFSFGFHLTCDFPLKSAYVTLGADKSSFYMEVQESNNMVKHESSHLTLLSDSYITLSLQEHCDFAITSEISYQNLQNKKHVSHKNEFKKSSKVYLYEKGSVIINPSQTLLAHLNNKNLQQIGYNIYTLGENN